MKKRYVAGMLLLASFLLLIGYNRYSYHFRSLDNATLFLGPIKSPDGQYQANAYYLPYGGAAGGVLYMVEAEHIASGEKKIIYSSHRKDVFSMKWKSADTLSIRNESPKYGEYRSVAALLQAVGLLEAADQVEGKKRRAAVTAAAT